jgi:multidrug efflux system membrane fusion protein
VFGNDGRTVVDTGTLRGIDNQVDPTTGTVKLKAEFPNGRFQLWPGQFVNVRLKVETLSQVLVVPTAAVQRGPAGTFSYVIGDDSTVSARPVTVVQQNENDAVVSKGLTVNDRVVTTGFANLADGAKVEIGRSDQTVVPDLAPRKRQGGGKAGGGDRSGQKPGQAPRSEQGTGAPGPGTPQGAEQGAQPGGSPKTSH